MTLQRREPLKRGAVVHTGRTTLSRRTVLRAMSKKKAEAAKAKAEVREAVFQRDGRCLLAKVPETGRCFGGPTFHHLRKEGQGGAYVESNGVLLCQGHNDWVEDQPYQAWVLGLVCRHGETPEDCWTKMRAIGLVPA